MARVVPPDKAPPSTPRTEFGDKTKVHQRYYLKDGTQVPGVTTVTGLLDKPALKGWAWKMGLKGEDIYKYTDEAKAIGSLAHELIAESLGGPAAKVKGYSPDQLERAQYSVKVFADWQARHGDLKPLSIELPLVSEAHHYGGTIDLVAEIDGHVELIDFKTGSGIWPEHEVQVGAYWKLLDEGGARIEGARILRIGRTEGESIDERTLTGVQVLNGWRVFEHCLAIHRLKKK